jgi:hypothetical protein
MTALDDPPDHGLGARALPPIVQRDVLLPIGLTSLVALACIPAPRFVGWFALLVLPAVFGFLVSRPAGVVSAVSAGLLYLWAYSEPRFVSRVTDPWTIRLAFALTLAGIAGACASCWYREMLRAH